MNGGKCSACGAVNEGMLVLSVPGLRTLHLEIQRSRSLEIPALMLVQKHLLLSLLTKILFIFQGMTENTRKQWFNLMAVYEKCPAQKRGHSIQHPASSMTMCLSLLLPLATRNLPGLAGRGCWRVQKDCNVTPWPYKDLRL